MSKEEFLARIREHFANSNLFEEHKPAYDREIVFLVKDSDFGIVFSYVEQDTIITMGFYDKNKNRLTKYVGRISDYSLDDLIKIDIIRDFVLLNLDIFASIYESGVYCIRISEVNFEFIFPESK